MAAGIGIGLERPVRLSRTLHAVSRVVGRKATGKGRRLVATDQRNACLQRPPARPSGRQYGRVDQLRADTESDIVRWEEYRAGVEAGVKITKREAIPRIVASVNETISELKERIEISATCGNTSKTPLAEMPIQDQESRIVVAATRQRSPCPWHRRMGQAIRGVGRTGPSLRRARNRKDGLR